MNFPSKSVILFLFSLFSIISLSWADSVSFHENFLQCLYNQSSMEFPISEAILTPKNQSFSSVLQRFVKNQRFNLSSTPKPLIIIAATDPTHLQITVICAKTHNLQIRIRSGGHDYEGLSYVSDVPFIILDMFNFREIVINVKHQTAWVQAGATTGELIYEISKASKVLGFPVGICTNLGIGGHISGGGYGNMMRKYGLSVDNVIDAEMVDANGWFSDRYWMGEDLFWAIRGGGGASFGVIASYKINLVSVPETVTVFQVERTLEQNATEIVYKWQKVASTIDNELFIRLTLGVRNNSETGKKTIVAKFTSLYLGESEKLLSIMNESFPELGIQKSDCTEMTWVESVLFWINLPKGTPTEVLLNRTSGVAPYFKRKSDYVQQYIPKSDLELIWKKMIELESVVLSFNPYGGKMDDIFLKETPFPHRKGNLWKIQYAVNWAEEGIEATNRYLNLIKELYEFMTPYVSNNPRLAFLNYRDLDVGINHHGENSYAEGRVYGLKFFRENFDRLVEIKTKVDPTNFFRNEQSIPILPK